MTTLIKIKDCEDCGTLITSGKSIHWCRVDREFRGHFDGNLICLKPSRLDVDNALNAYVYGLIESGLLPCPSTVEAKIYDLDVAEAAEREANGLLYLRELRSMNLAA